MKNKLARTLIALTLVLTMLSVSLPAFALPGAEEYAVVYNTSYLNLRQGPSSSSTWLGRSYTGDWVRVLGAEGNFYYVQVVSSGQYGYMSKNFLKISSGGTGNTGVVNNPISTQFLNLRQYPSYSAPVLGIYYNGTTFSILSSADGWYYVNINGVTGYFRSEYVRIGGGGGSEGTAVIRTSNGGPLNMRTAPSASASVSSSFSSGRVVSVLLKGNTFWRVSIDGVTGFMMSKYLTASSSIGSGVQPGNPPATNGYAVVTNPGATQRLNLREQPSASARVIAQYKNGIRMEVVAPGTEWCKVYGSASGNIGYMMTSYLTLYGQSGVPVKTVQNGSSYVNLRSAPSTTAGTIYTRVYSGAVVTILAPGDEWSKVQYNGVTGYMMSVFLK